jgi:E3 ubiquitin-protein ligase CHFR
VPAPRPRSPEISPLQHNEDYYRPCPHCASSNDFNWSCPEPIIDPSVDISRARLLSDGIPPGHAKCGSCDHIHATRAPSTSRCDFCHQSFCGLVVPTRCHAKRIREQRPIGLDNLMDILGNGDVYDAFGINAVEFDFMLDYLREHDINPGYIYSEVTYSLLNRLHTEHNIR